MDSGKCHLSCLDWSSDRSQYLRAPESEPRVSDHGLVAVAASDADCADLLPEETAASTFHISHTGGTVCMGVRWLHLVTEDKNRERGGRSHEACGR